LGKTGEAGRPQGAFTRTKADFAMKDERPRVCGVGWGSQETRGKKKKTSTKKGRQKELEKGEKKRKHTLVERKILDREENRGMGRKFFTRFRVEVLKVGATWHSWASKLKERHSGVTRKIGKRGSGRNRQMGKVGSD